MDWSQVRPVNCVCKELVLFEPSMTLFHALPLHVTEGACIHGSSFETSHFFSRNQLKITRLSNLNDALSIHTNWWDENSIMIFAEVFQFNCKRRKFSMDAFFTLYGYFYSLMFLSAFIGLGLNVYPRSPNITMKYLFVPRRTLYIPVGGASPLLSACSSRQSILAMIRWSPWLGETEGELLECMIIVPSGKVTFVIVTKWSLSFRLYVAFWNS